MSAVDLDNMQPVVAKVRLPFGFAKRFGVLLQAQADGWLLYVNPQTPPAALLEVRRLLSAPFKVQKLQQTEFDALLEASYQRDSSEAQQIMQDIGNEVDLASLADEIPETEDLLENEDDAPIIKLINAMLG